MDMNQLPALIPTLAQRVVELTKQHEVLSSALTKIAMLNPANDSDEGWNEWGEADCFRQAQNIAVAALNNTKD